MTKPTTPQNFEDAIAQLEKIVTQIEGEEINLDDALSKYQQGINLVKYCQSKLAEIEQKVKILDEDNSTLKDFAIE
jgi:exodeoxyribonuclease VII small subunit